MTISKGGLLEGHQSGRLLSSSGKPQGLVVAYNTLLDLWRLVEKVKPQSQSSGVQIPALSSCQLQATAWGSSGNWEVERCQTCQRINLLGWFTSWPWCVNTPTPSPFSGTRRGGLPRAAPRCPPVRDGAGYSELHMPHGTPFVGCLPFPVSPPASTPSPVFSFTSQINYLH